MNGKIVLCFAVVLVGQAMSAALFEEDVKKIGDQMIQSATSITSHFSAILGIQFTNADAQKNIEKAKTYVNKGLTDLEDQIGKLKNTIKDQSPALIEKVNEIEKNIKTNTANAKEFFDDKIGKVIDEKFKDDVKKFTESIIKITKEVENTVNKSIDSKKKP